MTTTAKYLNSYSESVASRLIGQDVIAISLSDSDQTYVILEIRVGSTAGDVKVTTTNGTATVIPNVQIGERLTGPFVRVWATGTTATGLTGVI